MRASTIAAMIIVAMSRLRIVEDCHHGRVNLTVCLLNVTVDGCEHVSLRESGTATRTLKVMLPSVHGLNDSVTGSLPRGPTVVIVPQLAEFSHLLILESLTGLPQFLTFRGVSQHLNHRVELLIGDIDPAQFGELLLDVMGRGVNDGQCLTGIGEPQVRVTGMLHLVCLPLLRESNGSGVVADNVRARTLVRRGNGPIETGGCQQVGSEFDTLRSDDG